MNYNTQATTLDLMSCYSCGVSLLATNRFCRLCGASQSRLEFGTMHHDNGLNLAPRNKRVARDGESKDPSDYLSISGTILNCLMTSELNSVTLRIKSRATRRVIAAAISLPLWLMIVLLSPFDAMEASRRFSKTL